MSFAVVAGCAEGLESDGFDGFDRSEVTSYEPYVPNQGRHILGKFPDTLAAAGMHFRVSVTPANRPEFQLSVNAAGEGGESGTHLVAVHPTRPAHEKADPWFVDLVMNDATPDTGRQLMIWKVEPTVSTPPGAVNGTGIVSTLYYLKYRPTSGDSWEDYCWEGSGAIPVAGYYDSKRTHKLYSPSDPSTPSISFACSDGAAQKCNHWGYIAGNAGPGAPGARDTSWDYHQACTAMANADYCGTGESHTFEGTPIQIRDFRPDFANPAPTDLSYPSEFPMNPDRYYIEAAWGPDGTPHCLSRSRWTVLPPDQCPRVLHPRNSAAAKFCEDASFEDIERAGALIVSASKVMTAPLLHWRNPATGDDVTTLHGYRENLDVRSAPGLQHAPFPGYSEYKGVDSVLLRNLPSTLQEAGEMIPLYMHVNEDTGDRVIATKGLSLLQQAGYRPGDLEGYAFHEPIDGPRLEAMKPLWLCRLDNDYLVTSAPSSIGCDPVERLGYALPPPSPSSDTP